MLLKTESIWSTAWCKPLEKGRNKSSARKGRNAQPARNHSKDNAMTRNMRCRRGNRGRRQAVMRFPYPGKGWAEKRHDVSREKGTMRGPPETIRRTMPQSEPCDACAAIAGTGKPPCGFLTDGGAKQGFSVRLKFEAVARGKQGNPVTRCARVLPPGQTGRAEALCPWASRRCRRGRFPLNPGTLRGPRSSWPRRLHRTG